MHWCEQYIGKPWSQDSDCWVWFRRWRKDHFGDEMTEIPVDHGKLVQCAARQMAGDIEAVFGWTATDAPVEGDAVFLSQRNQPHHIGMVVMLGGQMHVLHALEGVGVVVNTTLELLTNGWTRKGYYTPCR